MMEIVSVPENATFIEQFIRNPTNTLLYQGYALNLIDYQLNLKEKAEGVLGIRVLLPVPQYPNEESKKWADRFKKKFDEEPFGVSLFTYEPLMLWAEAVKAVGNEKDYRKICDYIRNAKYKLFGGGVIYFDKENQVPEFGDSMFTSQIQNGTATTLVAQSKQYMDNTFQLPPWIKE
jgi:branched-chain amino acid transport system substrate-binding protein